MLTVVTVACDHCILPRQCCLNACHDGLLAIVPAGERAGNGPAQSLNEMPGISAGGLPAGHILQHETVLASAMRLRTSWVVGSCMRAVMQVHHCSGRSKVAVRGSRQFDPAATALLALSSSGRNHG
jgi:hypothetical protein